MPLLDPSAAPPEVVLQFFSSHHTFTLATEGKEGPHATPLFYHFDPLSLSLIFMSHPETRHSADLLDSEKAAGAIFEATRTIEEIRGLQFSGKCRLLEEPHPGREEYLSDFPEALKIPGQFWILRIDFIKFTDNTRSFGEKTLWRRNP